LFKLISTQSRRQPLSGQIKFTSCQQLKETTLITNNNNASLTHARSRSILRLRSATSSSPLRWKRWVSSVPQPANSWAVCVT